MSTSLKFGIAPGLLGGDQEGSAKPVVAIWKVDWLGASETFVRNQLNAFQQWSTIAVGARRTDSPIAVAEDLVLFREGRIGLVQQKLFHITRRSRRLERMLKAADVSLIDAHFGYDATLVAPTARRLKIPLAVTVHGFDVTTAPRRGGFGGMLYRHRLRQLFDEAAVVLPVSEFIAGMAQLWGAPLNKMSVHHIGIPLEQPIVHVGVTTDVVFVGRLVEVKGVADLLTAVGGVPRSLRPRVLIVGEGPLRGKCESLARDLEVEAEFVGWQAPDVVRGYLASAKVFAAPSKTSEAGAQEALGMVFLEASNAGLPIVAYHHGGVDEAVIDDVTGFLAPEGDVDTLRDNIMRLLVDPGLAQGMGEAGRRYVSAHFDIVAQTELLETLFTGLADGCLR